MFNSFLNVAVLAGRAYQAWQAGESIVEFIGNLFENSDELPLSDEMTGADPADGT